jgi:hypothetical protein
VTRADWIFRPILWFVTASIIHVVLHEGSHALAAYALGFPATLFQYWVNWQDAGASVAQRAAVGAGGPTFSLIAGLACLPGYRRWSRSAAGLPLLYLSTIGIAMFFGNLMSTAFVGDFSSAATTLGLPMPIRYTASLTGAVGGAAVLFWQGRELQRWIPAKAGRVFGVIGVVVLPVVAGTGLIILVNQPMPAGSSFAFARMSEASFGLFTLLGAATGTRATTGGRSFRLWWIDGTFAVAALLVVRLAARGIPLTP